MARASDADKAADAEAETAACAPRSERKRAAIIAAARSAFLEEGFEATSMDRIAAAADVSKRTVYNHFDSKESLFAAVVRALYADLVGGEPFALDPSGDPAAVLSGFAKSLLAELARPERQKLIRVVIAESRRFPQVSALYFAEGKEPAVGRLAAWLHRQDASGRLVVADPVLAAQQFLGMLKESGFWPLVLGLAPTQDSDAVVGEAVQTFLARYARVCRMQEDGS